MAKILVQGEAGSGKTQLLESLDPKTTLVIARDSKEFELALPHYLVPEYISMDIFLYGGAVKVDGKEVTYAGVLDKIQSFNDAYGNYPETIVFDTVSQLTMDVIEVALRTPNKYGSQGAEITTELAKFTKFLHEYLEVENVNIILLAHVLKDTSEEQTEYLQFGQGKFLSKGAWYATVSEAITIVPENKHLAVYTKGKPMLARNTVGLPVKMYIESTGEPIKSKTLKEGEEYYTLNDHLQAVLNKSNKVNKFSL